MSTPFAARSICIWATMWLARCCAPCTPRRGHIPVEGPYALTLFLAIGEVKERVLHVEFAWRPDHLGGLRTTLLGSPKSHQMAESVMLAA